MGEVDRGRCRKTMSPKNYFYVGHASRMWSLAVVSTTQGPPQQPEFAKLIPLDVAGTWISQFHQCQTSSIQCSCRNMSNTGGGSRNTSPLQALFDLGISMKTENWSSIMHRQTIKVLHSSELILRRTPSVVPWQGRLIIQNPLRRLLRGWIKGDSLFPNHSTSQ